MKDELRIAFFDSGVGGLSLLERLMGMLKDKKLYYLADHAFCPYGDRSVHEIRERCLYLVRELLEIRPHLIIMACNTATLAALSFLKKMFSIPLLGIHPFVGYRSQKGDSVVVLTTPAAGKIEDFHHIKKEIDPEESILHFPCPRLAKIVEDYIGGGNRTRLIEEIRSELSPLESRSFTHVILGCTHYEHVGSIISEILGAYCVYPSKGMMREVMEMLVRLKRGTHWSESSREGRGFYYKTTSGTSCFEWNDLKDWKKKLP